MRVSLARRAASVGLIVMASGGLVATVAAADGPTSGGGLRVQKLTEDGKPLPGARYEATFCFYDIYSAPADRTWNCSKNDHWVSDDDGYLVLRDPSDVNDGIPFEQYPLVYGCVYCGDASEITTLVGVKEVEAPAGYDLNDSPSTYYPGYLDDGSDKWGTATANPGVETGAPTLVSQNQLGDAGTLRQVTGENFNGYEALYTNKFTRSGLDVRAVDQATGQGVPGAVFEVRLCDGDPENCRTLPQTFTSGQDGVLRDASGASLASAINPKMLESAKVTLTERAAAEGYATSSPVVISHVGGTSGWAGEAGGEPKSTIDLSMVKTAPTAEPTTPTTSPTSEPTTPTAEPTSPTSPSTSTSPTSEPTTSPASPTSEPTSPATEPTTPTAEPTSPTTSTSPTSEPTTSPASPTSQATTPTAEPTSPSTSTSPTSEPTTSTASPTSEPTTPKAEPSSPTSGPPSSTSGSSASGSPTTESTNPRGNSTAHTVKPATSSSSTTSRGPKVDTDYAGHSSRMPIGLALLGGTAIGGIVYVLRRSQRGGAYLRR